MRAGAGAGSRAARVACYTQRVSASILIVDDEKNIRRTLRMVLEGDGYRVLEAEHAPRRRSARSTSEERRPRILDLKLPGMSGLEALERLRAKPATGALPVIVITGHATVADAVHAVKLGATRLLREAARPRARARQRRTTRCDDRAAARGRAAARRARQLATR